jgi:hypothetical protein
MYTRPAGLVMMPVCQVMSTLAYTCQVMSTLAYTCEVMSTLAYTSRVCAACDEKQHTTCFASQAACKCV